MAIWARKYFTCCKKYFNAKWSLRYVLSGVLVAAVTLCLIQYFKLGRVIDRRLAEGPFSASADILAAPRTVSVGESITADEIVDGLERSGYTRSHDNPLGWFEQEPGVVEIRPGANSVTAVGPVKLEFARGRISSIVSLRDHAARHEYLLEPQLITNLSKSNEKRRPVRFEDIPPSLVRAVTAVEDKRFFRHGGFDLARMVKAAYIDIKDGRKQQGASTLTMQLARSLWLDRDKSWRRKMAEVFITMHLEHKLTKQQIFEDYANEIYLGNFGTFSINGFGEGAQAFFGKDLSQIDTGEAALLAGLARRPNYYNPFQSPERARERRDLVLACMRHNGSLSPKEYRDALASPVEIAPAPATDSTSPYFTALVNAELGAMGENRGRNRRIYTTLDPDLQRAAEAAVRAGMANVDQQLARRPDHASIPRGQPQVALVALDPRTGEIKALVGGRDYASSQLNHALVKRQPGSVFKPFVYAAAISTAVEGGQRVFTPATLLSDEATTFYFGLQSYSPKDFDGDYMGDVTLRTALAHSLNVATVSLAEQVGYKRIVAMARRAGLNDNQPTPSVALGTYEATPLEIAAAYTIFANQGTWVRPTAITKVRAGDGAAVYQYQPDRRAALDPRVAYVMVDMMEEVLRSGTGAAVRSRGFLLPAAGKTGTSRDGWFAGFTGDLECVVWVGFDDNRDLKLEGARSALPIWAEFMRRASQLPEYGSAHSFQPPSGIVSAQICADSGELAGAKCPNPRTEVFIAGTQPVVECELHNRRADGDRAMAGHQ